MVNKKAISENGESEVILGTLINVLGKETRRSEEAHFFGYPPEYNPDEL